MIREPREVGSQFVMSSKRHVCPQPRSLRICQNPAVNFILMVQHLLLSCALSPRLHSPPFWTVLCFMLSRRSLNSCLILSLSAEGPWTNQTKLANTDSDRANVHWVTSHARTGICPFQNTRLGFSALSFSFSHLAGK